MKRRTILFTALAVVLALSISAPRPVHAEGVKDAIEELNSDNSKGYLQPLFDCFANDLNSGIYTSASIPRVGLRLRLNLVAMGTTIGDKDRLFMGVAPKPYDQTPTETATVFGGIGATVAGPNVSYSFQNGQLTGDFVPLAVPQVEVGSILGTIARVRYFSAKLPGDAGKEIGKIELVGYGLQHSLSQYLLLCPIDISAGFFYQTFDLGDIMKCKTMNIGIQASKSLAVLTVFGGANFEKGNMNVSYTYEGEGPSEEIDIDIKSKTSFRFHVGAGLNIPGIHLSGAVYLGPQTSYAVGLGIGL